MEIDYKLKKRNITEFDTSLDLDQTNITKKNDYQDNTEKEIDKEKRKNFGKFLFPIFEKEKENSKLYEDFRKKEVIKNCPDFLIQNEILIEYPEEIKNFLYECVKNKEIFVFDYLAKINLFFIFSKNKIYFFKNDNLDPQKKVFFKEMDFNLSNITVVKIFEDDVIFMIFSESLDIHFFALNSKNEFLNLNLQTLNIFSKFTFFSEFSNSAIVIENNRRILNIKLSENNEQFKVNFVTKPEIPFGFKKVKQFTFNKIEDLKNLFGRRDSSKKHEYIIKEFKDIILVLEKTFDQNNQIEEKLTFLQYEKENYTIIKEINLNQIIFFNYIIFQNITNDNEKNYSKIFIRDFYLNLKNELLLLLDDETELTLNFYTLNIKKVKTFKFLNQAYVKLSLGNYLDEKTIIGYLDTKICFVKKSNINCFANDDFTFNDSWSLIDLGDFNDEFLKIAKIEQKNFLKNTKNKFLILTENGLKIWNELSKTELIANLILMEVFYSNFLNENYFEEFFSRKKIIGVDKFLKYLLNCILINQQNYFEVIEDFMSLLIFKFNILVKEFHHEQKENFDFLRFHMICCKYFNLFSNELKSLEIKKNEENLKKIKSSEPVEKSFLTTIEKTKNKSSENNTEKLVLKNIMKSIENTENERVLIEIEKDFKFNRKIEVIIESLKTEIISLLKTLYFFENIFIKNEDYINITTQFVDFIKNFKFLKKISQNFFKEKEMFTPLLIDFVKRIKSVIDFLTFFGKILKNVEIDSKRVFCELTLKDLFFYTGNDDSIKNVLVYNFDKVDNSDEFLKCFFEGEEISALSELRDFKNLPELPGNFKEDNFIAKIKFLQFRYLKEMILDFWQKKSFFLYLKLLLEKLKEKQEDEKNNEIMKIFVFATLINLLSEKNAKNYSMMHFFKKIYFCTKKIIFEKPQKQIFEVSKNLKNLSSENRVEITKKLINELLTHNNNSIRERTLFYLLEHNEIEFVKNSEYEIKIKDIIKVTLFNRDMFQSKIGISNGYYIVNFLIENKHYGEALEIILKILQNEKIEKFLGDFKCENFFYILNEDFDGMFEKWKTMVFLNLDEIQVLILQAKNLKKNIDFSDNVNVAKYDLLKNIELNVKLNMIIKKELLSKKKYFERLLNLDKNLINKEMIQKVIKILDFEVFFINLNPKYEDNEILERIIKNNKLYLTMYNLDEFVSNKSCLNYKKKILRNLIKYFGRLNTIQEISKIGNHFIIPDLFKNAELLKTTEIEKNKIFLKDFQKHQLIYPYNLPEDIHDILQQFIENENCSETDLKEIFQEIETFNMNSEYIKILTEQIFTFEKNPINSQTIWHFFFVWKKFENFSKEFPENLNIIYKYLNVYFLLCEDCFEKKISEENSSVIIKIEDNLKFKYIYNYLILFDFLMSNIKKILDKKEPFDSEKKLLIHFVKNFVNIQNQIEKLGTISPSSVTQNIFFTCYFKAKEKIKNSIKMAKIFFLSKRLNPYRNIE